MKLLLLAACSLSLAIGTAHGQERTDATPTWPQVVQLIAQVDAARSLASIEQALHANAPLVMHEGTEALLTGALQEGGLTEQQTLVLTLAQETVRDARAEGIPLAAATLGVRVTILQLLGAQTPADVRAILTERRDVTSSARLTAAFARIGRHPTVSPGALQELAAAFGEATTSLDAAVARLVRLANSGGQPNAAVPSTSPADPVSGGTTVVGHWRCTVSRGGGADLSMTTDHHMVLEADGTFRSWSHSVTVTSFGGSENTTPEERGRWTQRGSTFVFSQPNGTAEVPFRRSGETLLLPNESERRVWERTRTN
jgi:hypothetical protein